MKKSLYLFLSIAVLFFSTDRIVHLGLSNINKKVFSGQSGGKTNHFLSLKDSVNLLVFGSSRAYHHLDPRVLDSLSFNMGADGTRIAYSAALISSLKKENQIILVHIDPSAIYNAKYDGEDILGLVNLAHNNSTISNSISEIYPKEILLSKIFKCYAYNGKVLGLLKNYFIPKYDFKNYSGFDPILPSKEQKQIFNRLIKKTDFSKFKYNSEILIPNKLVESSISKIKKTCELNNSKLIFFTSPTLKKNDTSLIFATKKYFNLKGIPYYDYSTFLDISNTENWKDFTHLSAKGANLFSQKVKLELQHVLHGSK